MRRYLANQPVEAGPPSTAYQFRKFVSRNFGQVVTAAILILVICLGLIGTSIGMTMARTEAHRAWQAQAEAAAERDEAIQLAGRNQQLAERERVARLETENQVRVATSQRLAAQSQAVREELPVQGLLLARESVKATWRHDGTVIAIKYRWGK